jgi:hypothetical protein
MAANPRGKRRLTSPNRQWVTINHFATSAILRVLTLGMTTFGRSEHPSLAALSLAMNVNIGTVLGDR